MSQENSQKWLERNRPPRVQISYDVETGGASVVTELPLLVGIMADLSGDQQHTYTLGERRFVDIDRDNFDKVLDQIGPRLDIAGLNLPKGDGMPTITGSIVFNSIEDFHPDRLVARVDGLKQLFEARNNLRDLMAKLDGNAKLEADLQALFPSGAGAALSAEQQSQLKALHEQSMPPAKAGATGATGGTAPVDPAVAPALPVDPVVPVDPPAPTPDKPAA